MLNAPSTEKDDGYAIPENRKCATRVWPRDIIRADRRDGAIWFER